MVWYVLGAFLEIGEVIVDVAGTYFSSRNFNVLSDAICWLCSMTFEKQTNPIIAWHVLFKFLNTSADLVKHQFH